MKLFAAQNGAAAEVDKAAAEAYKTEIESRAFDGLDMIGHWLRFQLGCLKCFGLRHFHIGSCSCNIDWQGQQEGTSGQGQRGC